MLELLQNDTCYITTLITELKYSGYVAEANEIGNLALQRDLCERLNIYDKSTNSKDNDNDNDNDRLKNLFDIITKFQIDFSTVIEALILSENGIIENTQLASPVHTLINIEISRRYEDSMPLILDNFLNTLFDEWNEAKEIKNEQVLTLLCQFGWMQLYKSNFLIMLQNQIISKIQSSCNDDYLASNLSHMKLWLQDRLLSFAMLLFPVDQHQNITGLLTTFFHDNYSQIYAHKMFDMVTDFPESMAAIIDLRDSSTSASSSFRSIGFIFKNAICKRLLHPGATTSQIIDFYISTIRSLRVMDSTDILLNFVATPIRKYLSTRKDTVRCVVSSLTGGEGSDLYGELRLTASLEYGVDEEDEEKGPGTNWQPAKRDGDLLGSSGKGLDVLALLVSIYGSPDLFVAEYRSLLADKLIRKSDYSSDQEVKNLELLKIRFGEESLHSCEVMLRDLEDSRRVNTAVTAAMKQKDNRKETAGVVDCLLISDNYWPSPPADSFSELVMHPAILSLLETYKEEYAVLRKPRVLGPLPHLGMVFLELTFLNNVMRVFEVTPHQASLILYFGDGARDRTYSDHTVYPNSMPISELVKLSNLTEIQVRQFMRIWVMKNVVLEVLVDASVVYVSVEDQSEWSRGLGDCEGVEGEVERELVGNEDMGHLNFASQLSQDELSSQQNKVMETYIRGMLANTESMSIERIYNMLRMMSSASSSSAGADSEWRFDLNMLQMKKYLQILVDSDILEIVEEGNYRLRKNT